jgi:hypothetical protein
MPSGYTARSTAFITPTKSDDSWQKSEPEKRRDQTQDEKSSSEKKSETCKRPQQYQKNQKPQPIHMIFIAFFLLATSITLPQAK